MTEERKYIRINKTCIFPTDRNKKPFCFFGNYSQGRLSHKIQLFDLIIVLHRKLIGHTRTEVQYTVYTHLQILGAAIGTVISQQEVCAFNSICLLHHKGQITRNVCF